ALEAERKGHTTPTLTADGKRPRSAAQLAALEKLNEQRSIDENHKLVMYGSGFGCSCGQIHSHAGRSRSSAEFYHRRHQGIVQEMIDHRKAEWIPDALFD